MPECETLESLTLNRIEQCLADLKAKNKKALVSYIVCGDPLPNVTLPAMHALVESGVDIIELGVPFSDPMAEGPAIQRGHERSLAQKTSLRKTFEVVKQFRETNSYTPVVLMGYANPVVRMGYKAFAEGASEAGVDGLLTVDLPAEEATDLNVELAANNLKNIFLLAPTTTEQRMKDVVSIASGFLYYVSLKGVTGAGHLDIASVEAKLSQIKTHTDLPVLVGFGIKDAESAAAVGEKASGVIVGSVLVDAMGKAGQGDAEYQTVDEITGKLTSIISPMRAALDQLN